MNRTYSIVTAIFLSILVIAGCKKTEDPIDETPVVVKPVPETPFVLTAPACMNVRIINADTLNDVNDTIIYDGQKRPIRRYGDSSMTTYVYTASQILQYDTIIPRTGAIKIFRTISDINSKGYKTRSEFFTPTEHYFENYTYDSKDFLVRMIKQDASNIAKGGAFHEILNNNRTYTWYLNFDGSGNLIDSAKRVKYVYENKTSSFNHLNSWVNRLGRPNHNVLYITQDTIALSTVSRIENLDANGNPYMVVTSDGNKLDTTIYRWNCQ